MERKQATHPEQLCRGYPSEFKDFFAHCSGLGFEDRPDYRYLKRIFKDLFERQALEDDLVYDWDVLKRHQDAGGQGTSANNTSGQGMSNVDESDKGKDMKIPGGSGNGGMQSGVSSSGKISPRANPAPPPATNESGKVTSSEQPQQANPPRRSLISSIRNSLFGSRNGTRADAGSASQQSQSKGVSR